MHLSMHGRLYKLLLFFAVAPIGVAWEGLKTAFSNLVATVTGGQGTMGNLWNWLGNILQRLLTV